MGRHAWNDEYEYEDRLDGMSGVPGEQFANPGSALRASGPGNPRNLPCPTCKAANRLTPADRALGYQCDRCADRVEAGFDY